MLSGGYKFRNPEGIYFVTFAVVEWVDVFTRSVYSDIVVESLDFCINEKGLRLHAWCIMSNHIHLIISAEEGFKLSDILRDLKKYTSVRILKTLEENTKESRRNWMLWIFRAAGEKNSKNTHYQFWQNNNHPKELNTNELMDQKLEYIHQNPVKAGLVNSAEAWVYSSARDYAGETGLLPLVFIE